MDIIEDVINDTACCSVLKEVVKIAAFVVKKSTTFSIPGVILKINSYIVHKLITKSSDYGLVI